MKAGTWIRDIGSALLVLIVASATAHAQQSPVVSIDDIDLGDLQSVTFRVDKATDIRINAVGAERTSSDVMFAYPWIINDKSRELVWAMDQDFTDPIKDSEWLRKFDDEVSFEPGTYDLYYFASEPFSFSFSMGNTTYSFSKTDKKDLSELDEDIKDLLNSLGTWLKEGKGSIDRDDLVKLTRQLHVALYADAGIVHVAKSTPSRERVVALVHPDNDAYLSQGFTLKKAMDLDVYAIGEYYSSDETMVDWGWIIDAKTRDRVWEMTRRNTDWAGGAEKNRRYVNIIHLPAGNYVAYYVCDDSHTFNDWNAPPPYDPDGWGLQISVTDPKDTDEVAPYEDTYTRDAIVSLTRVGDNELVSESFKVEKPTKLRIYAIGEYDRFGDEMADYGWIVDRGTGRKVWVMKANNTEPAGGASKNRMFDGVVEFEPGEYTVYYSSDGSHSYGDGWNASPPFDQKSYGISILTADPDAEATAIRLDHVSGTRTDAIAEIVGVRDDQKKQTHFSLTTPTRISIHAVGEGTRYGMVDYGWIENARTGDVVWEMTYRKTSHAGGAEKNRVVDQTIILDKGEYVLYYVTDDSHATGDWNASPPDDPASWGIVLTKADRDGE